MVENENSFLILSVLRETRPGNNDYSPRKTRAYTKLTKEETPDFSNGTVYPIKKLGNKIAFVSRYKKEMLEGDITSVIEVDEIAIENPLIIERKTVALEESILFVAGTETLGPWQIGFIPNQAITHDLGKTLDGKIIRIKICDARPA